tara:strand:+ start:371 stop:1411 length:1041 start_codon:yes stop_codon:yes gene_type:complete
MKIHSLIIAGGKGTRFWPVSTTSFPKQYNNLLGENSLLFDTIKRTEGFVQLENRYIITVENQKDLAQKQTEGLNLKENIIIEPEGRNTAPCIFLGLLQLIKNGAGPNDCVVVLPSDHVIKSNDLFANDINMAAELSVKNQSITVIGIKPTFPNTGFGYIKKGKELEGKLSKVETFVEKPDLEKAKEYIESGKYYWNAGMFIAPINTLIDEFSKCSPEVFQHKDELMDSLSDPSKLKVAYEKLPKNSIDYAVIEKSNNIQVIPADFDWNDLGAWDALSDVFDAKENNYPVNLESFQGLESKNNIIYAPGKKVSLINMEDMIVVAHGDHILVMPKDGAQKVKSLNHEI